MGMVMANRKWSQSSAVVVVVTSPAQAGVENVVSLTRSNSEFGSDFEREH